MHTIISFGSRRWRRPSTRLPALLLVLFAPALAAQTIISGDPVPQLAAFDTALVNLMNQHDITQAEMAITWQGRLVLAHGYTRNRGPNDVGVQPVTRMRIASNSKQITSILVNRLIQDGALSLNDTLSQFVDLTPLPGESADPRLAKVTVRNLLEHLAGFGNYGIRDPMFADPQIAAAVGTSLPIHQDDIIRAMNGVALNSNPGTTFQYSNYGYLLLGRIIEVASGMSYEAYAKSIFQPLGIHLMRLGHSRRSDSIGFETGYYSGIQRATVFDDSGTLVPYEYGAFNLENMDSHGGWIMSAVELVRIASNLDNPAAPTAVLNHASLARMFARPQNYAGPYTPGDPYYASGWSVRDYGNGHYNTWHDGSLPGTTSYMARIQDGWDFVVILNRRAESGNACYSCEIDTMMWNVRQTMSPSQWPTHDLFPKMLDILFIDGF